jgi:Zn-dependent protease with chaperone function
MWAVFLVGVLIVSAAMAFSGNWLALKPWRRARALHWTEQARVSYPVRVGAANNLWAIPAVMVTGSLLLRMDYMPRWWLVGLFAIAGTVTGTIHMGKELFPRLNAPDYFRNLILGWLMRLVVWSVFVASAATMPRELNLRAGIGFLAVVLFLIAWSYDGWLRVGKLFGLVAPADEELCRVVDDVSRKVGIPVRSVLLLKSDMCAAYALATTGTLLFSTRLLKVLNAGELRAVCSHELAHLSESRVIVLLRHAAWFYFLPWVLIKPVFASYGSAGVSLLVLVSLSVQQIMLRVNRSLEKRADKMATESQEEAGVYARALEAVYRDNLIPAVISRRQTHPDLYDRMLSAGITPDYPRPKPAESLAANGWFFLIVFGVLVGLWLAQTTAENPWASSN